MNFNDLVKKAAVRTAMANFKDLFEVELIITPNNEIAAAIEGATKDVLNTTTGLYETEIDQGKLREFLVSRVAGFKKLTLQKALTLCGRELPNDMMDKGKEPLKPEKETVETLLLMVVGLQTWCLTQLKTLGEEAARLEVAAQGN